MERSWYTRSVASTSATGPQARFPEAEAARAAAVARAAPIPSAAMPVGAALRPMRARAAAVALPVVDVDPRLHAARCQTLGRPIVAATRRAPGSAQATAWRPDEEVDAGALRAVAAAYRAASRAALVSVVMAHGSDPTATRGFGISSKYPPVRGRANSAWVEFGDFFHIGRTGKLSDAHESFVLKFVSQIHA